MSKPKTVLVEIFATRVLTYRQQKVMAIEDYNKIKDLQDVTVDQRNSPAAYHVLEDYINPHEVYDAANEFDSVEVEVVGKEAIHG